MKDLLDTILQNEVSVFSRRKKAQKGSKIARYKLAESLGSEGSEGLERLFGKDSSWLDVDDLSAVEEIGRSSILDEFDS